MADHFDDSPLQTSVERLHTLGFLLGTASGWKDAGEHLIKLSGPAFAAGRDAEARQLRDLGRLLLDEAATKRAYFDEESKQHRAAEWNVVADYWERAGDLPETEEG